MRNRLKSIGAIYGIQPFTIISILILPFLLVAGFSQLWISRSTRYYAEWLRSENHPIELATFFILIIGGIYGLKFAVHLKRREEGVLIFGFYVLFSLGLLLFALEEIAWGQWFFGFNTPEFISRLNKQNEFTFHNITSLHAPFEYLRVAIGISGLMCILLSRKPRFRKIGAPAILLPWFLWIIAIAVLDLHNLYIPRRKLPFFRLVVALNEMLELLIASAGFLYIWLNRRRFLYNWKRNSSS